MPPADGPLASGQSGVGRLAELDAIVDAVVAAVADRPVRAADPAARPPLVAPAHDADLEGRHIVVTAGGTREAIDPVRFIGNRSTGKMGAAIAQAALDRGARVTLVAANVEVPLPTGATIVRVESTADLRAALLTLDPRRHARGRLRCAGHGRGRRRLPAERNGRSQARARLGDDARARADARRAQADRPHRPRPRRRRRPDPRCRRAAALSRRVRGGDRLARPDYAFRRAFRLVTTRHPSSNSMRHEFSLPRTRTRNSCPRRSGNRAFQNHR